MSHTLHIDKHNMSDDEFIAALDLGIAQINPKRTDTVTVNDVVVMEHPKMFFDDLANKIWLHSLE